MERRGAENPVPAEATSAVPTKSLTEVIAADYKKILIDRRPPIKSRASADREEEDRLRRAAAEQGVGEIRITW
ncbi:MAG TPA: hypothetical protein VMR59_00615 [Patescibacteria group bacterium]|jgi:hypothetical protein|nr:hypothetical protein [Patescibacteria group bacterium]